MLEIVDTPRDLFNDGEANDNHSLTLANSDNENTLNNRCYQCIICGPMFFLNKKKNLWKRLWRSRVCTTTSTTSNLVRQQQHQHQQQPLHPQPDQYYQLACETSAESYYYQQQQPQQHQQRNCGSERGESSPLSTSTGGLINCCTNTNSDSIVDLSDQTQLKFRTLVSKLKKDSQLETLCQAVESVGVSDVTTGKANRPQDHQPTDCVLVPRGNILGEEPQVIACRLWRWQDLYNSDEIKRIPSCPNEKDPVYICCNPAHWSRICRTGKLILNPIYITLSVCLRDRQELLSLFYNSNWHNFVKSFKSH